MPHPGRHTGKTVVVTGASAGVGRATALAFARHGAQVALMGRDAAALESTRAEIAANNGHAITLPVDMADAVAVFSATQQCENHLGPIDIWVNNAMATVFSFVKDIHPDEYRRVTEVTYLGTVHGTLAALQTMRTRNRGVIVQVGSSLAYRGIPLQAAYCGAKHAIRGFTDALRSELLYHHSAIQLTAVHLPAMNTPQFSWARTHQPTTPRPVAPIYQSEVAARAIVHAASHPQREYWLGSRTPWIILSNALAPGLLDHLLARVAVKGQSTGQPVSSQRLDNLFLPVPAMHGTDGAFGNEAAAHTSLYSSTRVRVTAVACVCLGAGLLGLLVDRLARRLSSPTGRIMR